MSWFEGDADINFQVGQGGRWELPHGPADIDVVLAVGEQVARGQVRETFAPARSCVRVTMPDGSIRKTSVISGCGTLFAPLPFWTHWGRTTQHEPY